MAMNSFRGCLPSLEAEKAAEEGIKLACPDCKIIRFPIADGDEGVLAVLVEATWGTYQEITANDPLMCPIEATYGTSGDERIAFIGMAVVNGLPLLSEMGRNPMLTTIYGTGELILHTVGQGYWGFVIGIGGSAANDAGVGLLQTLGVRFPDKGEAVLEKGGEILHRVAAIDLPSVHPALKGARFTIACDMRSPLVARKVLRMFLLNRKGRMIQW